MSNKQKEKSSLIKCFHCKKKKVNFYIHECERSYQEFFGCPSCDNWCIYCNTGWNNNDKKQ